MGGRCISLVDGLMDRERLLDRVVGMIVATAWMGGLRMVVEWRCAMMIVGAQTGGLGLVVGWTGGEKMLLVDEFVDGEGLLK